MTTPNTSATDITTLELDAIRAIAENEYQDMDPRDPEIVGHAIWSSGLAGSGGLTRKNVAGVLGSLAKKGLAGFQKDSDGDMCWLTAAGHAVYLAQGGR